LDINDSQSSHQKLTTFLGVCEVMLSAPANIDRYVKHFCRQRRTVFHFRNYRYVSMNLILKIMCILQKQKPGKNIVSLHID